MSKDSDSDNEQSFRIREVIIERQMKVTLQVKYQIVDDDDLIQSARLWCEVDSSNPA